MENDKFREAVLLVIGTGGTIAVMANPEQQITIVAITGFLALFILFSWPEYETYEQLYNPAYEPEKLSWWERFKEAFLKMGWKVRERKRRKN